MKSHFSLTGKHSDKDECESAFESHFGHELLVRPVDLHELDEHLHNKDLQTEIARAVRDYVSRLSETDRDIPGMLPKIARSLRKRRQDDLTAVDLDASALASDPALQRIVHLSLRSGGGGMRHIQSVSRALIHSTISIPLVFDLKDNYPRDMVDLYDESHGKVRAPRDATDQAARYITGIILRRLKDLTEDDRVALTA